ncbi:MAG TPA: TonB-dependent receptor [Steroidobacter sp.]|uniref:TonB-dependent receptor n=1 Tax=Steroidobacter sp. TaxID=1978227 RepID=UPI002EDA80CB
MSKRGRAIRAGLPCTVAVAALVAADGSLAQAVIATVHIEAQSVDAALRELSRQTNTNILFSPDAVQGLQAPALSANMTAEEAANALIAGTQLEVVKDATGALVVRRRVAPPTSAVNPLEEVIVTGMRVSLAVAQQSKRGSDTFVDSVAASDINALPDRSVTEALQRVPGVAIDRFTARTDPDHFSIEGSGLSVRGLTQVRGEFNGRDVFTANSHRGLSFQDVSPELLAGVDVYKNQSADQIEGGIGGLVNLRTRLPFDTTQRIFSISADGSYGDIAEHWTPSYSGLYSDRFDTQWGEFGVLFNYAYSLLRARTDGMQVEPFFARDDLVAGRTVLVPRGGAIRRNEHEREREGVTLAAQWANSDRKMIATAQYIRSEATQIWNEHAVEFDADHLSTSIFPVSGTEFEYNDAGVFTRGTLTAHTDWRGGDPRTLAMPYEYGAQHHIDNRVNWLNNTIDDVTFSFRFAPSERFSLTFDAQYATSKVRNLDWGVFGAAWANTKIDLRGDAVRVVMLPPSPDLPASFTSDPASTFWRSAQDHVEDSDGDELATRLDLDLDLGSRFLDSLRIGARYATREQNTRYAQYNWGVLSEVWAEDPPPAVWFDQALQNHTEVYAFDNFFRGAVPGQGVFIYPGGGLVADYQGAKAPLREIAESWRSNARGMDWRPVDQRDGAIGNFRPDELHTTDEQTTALYAMLKFGGDRPVLGRMKMGGNVGVRWVRTRDEAQGFESFPDLRRPADCSDGATGTPLDPHCVLSDEDLAFGDGTVVARNAVSDYDDLLPSLNLKVDLTPSMLLRFGASRAISRPELGLLRNYVRIVFGQLDGSGSGFSARAGNPFLKPMESDQFDLSLEWYFAPTGAVTATAFYKDLKNFFINGVVERDFTNAGVTRTVDISTVVNGDHGRIQGYELSYQQFYDFLPGLFSGFGLLANYTHITQEGAVAKNYDTTLPTPGGGAIAFDNVPLEGLSEHNANVVAMYERGPFSVRLAYNWRSQYLLTTRDVITLLPIYQDDTGQLDATAYFSITPSVKLGIEGVNLANEVTVLKQQFDNERTLLPRANFINDRRYALIFRATF